MLSHLIEIICGHWRLFAGLFLAQGAIGVFLFEWSWKKAERVRVGMGNEALMEEFPSFKRLDVHLWSRSKFYPGCFIILVPRVLWIFFWLFAVGFWQLLLFAGKSKDTPLTGWRRTAHKWMIWTHVPLIILGFGYYIDHTSHSEESVDYYSKYLGPEWRKNKFEGKRVSTLISNHVSFIEVLVWMSRLTPPAFTPGHMVKH